MVVRVAESSYYFLDNLLIVLYFQNEVFFNDFCLSFCFDFSFGFMKWGPPLENALFSGQLEIFPRLSLQEGRNQS